MFAVIETYEEDPQWPDERGQTHGGALFTLVEVGPNGTVPLEDFATYRAANTARRVIEAML